MFVYVWHTKVTTAYNSSAASTADLRRLTDFIISFDYVVEAVLPVNRHKGHANVVQEQGTLIAADRPLYSRGLPVLDDRLKAPELIFRHGDLSCARVRLCRFNDEFQRFTPIKAVPPRHRTRGPRLKYIKNTFSYKYYILYVEYAFHAAYSRHRSKTVVDHMFSTPICLDLLPIRRSRPSAEAPAVANEKYTNHKNQSFLTDLFCSVLPRFNAIIRRV